MEGMSPFETQLQSQWVQGMLEQKRNDFGFHHLPWKRRSLMAIPRAGIEGKRLTPVEIEDVLAPYVGNVADRAERSQMIAIGVSAGIIEKANTKRRPPGARAAMQEYDIVGHMELQGEELVPILHGEIK